MLAYSTYPKSFLLLVILSTLASHTLAQSADETVQELNFKRGDRQIEFKTGTLKKRGEDRQSGAVIGYQYDVSDFWSTQLSAEYKREEGNGTQFDAIEWENKFKFTQPDQLPVDIGLLTEIDWQKDRDEGYQVRFGPLFQMDIHKVQLNLNVLFERHFSETPSRPTELGYQWQAKYNWKENFQFGLQGFGEMGEWDDWAPRSEQSHRFGPAIFGEVSLGGSQKLEYDTAYLTDPSSRARSHGLRMQVKYKF
jgi:hypothetical protein